MFYPIPPHLLKSILGNTQHQCEDNGKKCNATSTLSVHTFSQKSTMTCVVRHKALGSGNLTATVHLSHNIRKCSSYICATFYSISLIIGKRYRRTCLLIKHILKQMHGRMDSSQAENTSCRNQDDSWWPPHGFPQGLYWAYSLLRLAGKALCCSLCHQRLSGGLNRTKKFS